MVGVTVSRLVSHQHARPWLIYSYKNLKGRGNRLDEQEEDNDVVDLDDTTGHGSKQTESSPHVSTDLPTTSTTGLSTTNTTDLPTTRKDVSVATSDHTTSFTRKEQSGTITPIEGCTKLTQDINSMSTPVAGSTIETSKGGVITNRAHSVKPKKGAIQSPVPVPSVVEQTKKKRPQNDESQPYSHAGDKIGSKPVLPKASKSVSATKSVEVTDPVLQSPAAKGLTSPVRAETRKPLPLQSPLKTPPAKMTKQMEGTSTKTHTQTIPVSPAVASSAKKRSPASVTSQSGSAVDDTLQKAPEPSQVISHSQQTSTTVSPARVDPSPGHSTCSKQTEATPVNVEPTGILPQAKDQAASKISNIEIKVKSPGGVLSPSVMEHIQKLIASGQLGQMTAGTKIKLNVPQSSQGALSSASVGDSLDVTSKSPINSSSPRQAVRWAPVSEKTPVSTTMITASGSPTSGQPSVSPVLASPVDVLPANQTDEESLPQVDGPPDEKSKQQAKSTAHPIQVYENGEPLDDGKEAPLGPAVPGVRERGKPLKPVTSKIMGVPPPPTGTYQRVRLVCRPWRTPEGTINRPILRMMLEALLLYIMTKPGLTQKTLEAKYNAILQPVPLMELVEMLEQIGCVQKNFVRKIGKPALFSDRQQYGLGKKDSGADTLTLLPSVDSLLKLSQFIMQIQTSGTGR